MNRINYFIFFITLLYVGEIDTSGVCRLELFSKKIFVFLLSFHIFCRTHQTTKCLHPNVASSNVICDEVKWFRSNPFVENDGKTMVDRNFRRFSFRWLNILTFFQSLLHCVERICWITSPVLKTDPSSIINKARKLGRFTCSLSS